MTKGKRRSDYESKKVLVSVIVLVIILVIIFLKIYPTNKNVLWKFKEKGLVYSILFSKEHKKVLIIKSDGLSCYDLLTGKRIWNSKDIKMYVSPTIFNNEVFAGTTHNSLARIDINTGKNIDDYNVDGRVTLTQLGENNLLYFVSRKENFNTIKEGDKTFQVIDSIYTLKRLDLSTGVIKSLFQFKGEAIKPIVISKENIAISVYIGYDEGKIYCINKTTGELKWEREMYNSGGSRKLVGFNESLFYVDLQKNLKNSLVELDFKTGAIINRIKPEISEWFVYEDYVSSPHIDFDRENILLFGDYFFAYNLKSEELTKLIKIPEEGYSTVVLTGGKIIYPDAEAVYSFDIKEKTVKEIYKSGGSEVFYISADNEFTLLILAKSVHEALADYKDFTYVMLKSEYK